MLVCFLLQSHLSKLLHLRSVYYQIVLLDSMVFMAYVDCVPVCTISRFAVMAVRFDVMTSEHDQP